MKTAHHPQAVPAMLLLWMADFCVIPSWHDSDREDWARVNPSILRLHQKLCSYGRRHFCFLYP